MENNISTSFWAPQQSSYYRLMAKEPIHKIGLMQLPTEPGKMPSLGPISLKVSSQQSVSSSTFYFLLFIFYFLLL